MKDSDLEKAIRKRYLQALKNEFKGENGVPRPHPSFDPVELKTGTKAQRLEHAKFYLRQVALFTGYQGLAEIAELLEPNTGRLRDRPKVDKIQMRVLNHVYRHGLTTEKAIARTAQEFNVGTETVKTHIRPLRDKLIKFRGRGRKIKNR